MSIGRLPTQSSIGLPLTGLIFIMCTSYVVGWSAIGNLGHCLNQDCGIIAISLKGISDGEPNEEDSPPIIGQVFNQKRPHLALGRIFDTC